MPHYHPPHLGSIDAVFPLALEGYEFIQRRCEHFHSDVFVGRLLGQRAVFMRGSAAAQLFYDAQHFRRADAMPALVKKTLFGEGGVQGLDDEAHRQRKALFLSFMTRASIAGFLSILRDEWDQALDAWQQRPLVVLLEEAQNIFNRAACRWAGVPSSARDDQLARDCSAMFNGFATIGPRMWQARAARLRAEARARDVIAGVRTGKLIVPAASAAYVMAHAHEEGGMLPREVAAVELLNVIRPTTAIAQYVAFMALALHDQPRYRQLLRSDDALAEAFVHETRRFYPFTPFVGARARHALEWQGVSFAEGTLAILDVYGALHDPREWDTPQEFRAERFVGKKPGAFDYMPQGGGPFELGHRCAGEWLTIEALKLSLEVLTRAISYELPAQDLHYTLARIPCAPRSGVVLRNVKREGAIVVRADAPVRGLDHPSHPA